MCDVHIGETLKISYFFKILCSIDETKTISYLFYKIHCSIGETIVFAKNYKIYRFYPLLSGIWVDRAKKNIHTICHDS